MNLVLSSIGRVNGLGCNCQGLQGISYSTQPTTEWTCQEWMLWHQELVKAFMGGKFKSGIKYTQGEATRLSNQVFTEWWDKLVDWFSNKRMCGYESQFYNYFRSVGLDNVLSYIQALLVPTTQTVTSTIENVGKTVENISEGAAGTGKTLKWLLPLVLLGGVVFVGSYAYKNYIKGNEKIKVSPL